MKTQDITVKYIRKQLNLLNPIVHDYGHGRTTTQECGYMSLVNFLGEQSLAMKIYKSNPSRYSDKQLWVIAYELMKCEEFKQILVNELEEMYGEGIEADELEEFN